MNTKSAVSPPEPSVALLRGNSFAIHVRRLWLSTRPAFLTASVPPVLVGSAWGFRIAGEFHALSFTLAVLATVLVHAASNVLNDVGDDIGGTDNANEERIFPYTGGSRFIQNGVMSASEMKAWGMTFAAWRSCRAPDSLGCMARKYSSSAPSASRSGCSIRFRGCSYQRTASVKRRLRWRLACYRWSAPRGCKVVW